MIKLIIFADDLTGALDTSVQFSKLGIATKVTLLCDIDEVLATEKDAEVLAVDTASRHLDAEDAYEKLYRLTQKAVAHGVPHIYKKTDSALRGNVGAELAAVWRATGCRQLPFLPAYPDNHCVTLHGEQIIDGVMLHESAVGADAFNAVAHSHIGQIIRQQHEVPVAQAGHMEEADVLFSGIVVYDSASNEDLLAIGHRLAEAGALRVSAGCAGFAAALPQLIDFSKRPAAAQAFAPRKVLVVSGSLDANSIQQINYLREKNRLVVTLADEMDLEKPTLPGDVVAELVEKVTSGLLTNGLAAIESRNSQSRSPVLPENRDVVTGHIADIVKQVLDKSDVDTLIVFGGDTCRGVLSALGCETIWPRHELAPGIVQTSIAAGGRKMAFISKAGRFGAEDLFEKVLRL